MKKYHRRYPMTLLQLLYFDTLAWVLHYTRAAQELHISQPSLSYAINELEMVPRKWSSWIILRPCPV